MLISYCENVRWPAVKEEATPSNLSWRRRRAEEDQVRAELATPKIAADRIAKKNAKSLTNTRKDEGDHLKGRVQKKDTESDTKSIGNPDAQEVERDLREESAEKMKRKPREFQRDQLIVSFWLLKIRPNFN